MNNAQFRRNLANTLRKMPWMVTLARPLWRLRQAKFSAGVCGVILNEVGEVLLVEHVFHPFTPWGLPGGWVERKEAPDQTLKREMQEELSLEVEIGPLLLVELEFGNHLDMAYLCKPINQVGVLSSELLDYRWCPPSEIPKLYTFHERAITQALQTVQVNSQV